MLSLDLRQILPPKMPFFKCKFRQKFCHKFRILPIPSKINIFVTTASFRRISSVFHQKRNPLEPNNGWLNDVDALC